MVVHSYTGPSGPSGFALQQWLALPEEDMPYDVIDCVPVLDETGHEHTQQNTERKSCDLYNSTLVH